MGKTMRTGQLSRATGIAQSAINYRCRDGRIRAIRPMAIPEHRGAIAATTYREMMNCYPMS